MAGSFFIILVSYMNKVISVSQIPFEYFRFRCESTRPGSLFRLYFLAKVARKFPVVRGPFAYPESPYNNGKQLVILPTEKNEARKTGSVKEQSSTERNNEQRTNQE
jgi:hypothetical protein